MEALAFTLTYAIPAAFAAIGAAIVGAAAGFLKRLPVK